MTDIKDEREVGANGLVEEIKTVGNEEILRRISLKLKRFVDKRFIYRVFARKENRNRHQMKQVAIVLVKNLIVKHQSHLMTQQKGISTEYKHILYCSFNPCPFKAVILLFCSIENPLNDNTDMLEDYSGFMIFVGYKGTHETTKEDEFTVIEGFEKLNGIYTNHYIPRNNLAGIPVSKKLSAYKNPEEILAEQQNPKIKFGLMQIPEIKQIIRNYQKDKDYYNPVEILTFIKKWVLDLQESFTTNQVLSQELLFAESMLDLWNDTLVEDKHDSYQSMTMKELETQDSICYDFEDECGINDNKLILKLKCWDQKSALEQCEKQWSMFCKIANLMQEKDIEPWVSPSIEFTGNKNIESTQKIPKGSKENIEELEKITYRNNKKETVSDRDRLTRYKIIGNIMEVDVLNHDADFKTVDGKLKDETIVLLKKLEKAQKGQKTTNWFVKDAIAKDNIAKDKIREIKQQLRKNDELNKEWLALYKYVITRALESQRVKVGQVDGHIGEQAQLNRCKEPSTYLNQYNQAIEKFIPKLEICEKSLLIKKLEEKTENFDSRIKQEQDIQLDTKQLKNRKRRQVKGNKSLPTPGMPERLAQFEKKMKKFRGANIIMNPVINENVTFIPNPENVKVENVGVDIRKTSQVVQTEELKKTKIQESPRSLLDSYQKALQDQLDGNDEQIAS